MTDKIELKKIIDDFKNERMSAVWGTGRQKEDDERDLRIDYPRVSMTDIDIKNLFSGWREMQNLYKNLCAVSRSISCQRDQKALKECGVAD